MEIKLILNILITMMINSIVILPIVALIVDARDEKRRRNTKIICEE